MGKRRLGSRTGPWPTAPRLSFDHKPHPGWPRTHRVGLALMTGVEHQGTQPQSSEKVIFALGALFTELKGGSYRGAKHVDTMVHAILRWQRETNT